MSLYIIEDRYGALRDSSVNYKYAKSLQQSKYPDGHIVELVPAKPKVQVSQEEADMLERAKNPTNRPSFMITEYSNSHKGNMLGNDLEDRLMRAYVNGYTVAKEKKYVVYKNLGGKHNTDVQYAQAYRLSAHSETFSWIITSWILNADDTNGSSFQFTESEIEHYGLQDCEKEEVTDDDD